MLSQEWNFAEGKASRHSFNPDIGHPHPLLKILDPNQPQEPITRSLHLCCTVESTLSNEELFLEQAFLRKSIVSEDVNVNEHDWAAHWLVDWLLSIRAWQILRIDWLIGYYALVRDKFCPKTVSINNFSSERVDSEGLYGRWRLRVMGSCQPPLAITPLVLTLSSKVNRW